MDPAERESARFVFKGTVKGTKSANVGAVTDRRRTIVARVDELIRAPESLTGYVGQDITVHLAKGERVAKGQQALFYTNGWIFGENLAVRSVGHERISATRTMEAAAGAGDAVSAAARQEIRQHATSAPVIVRGRVVAVGQPAVGSMAMTADAQTPTRYSEHDPFWTEAIVDVEKLHKGTLNKERIVVRFPASTDVRWSHAPKFEVGQEGVFMLQPDEVSQVREVGATAAALGSEEAFVCLGSADFQPADRDAEIHTVLNTIGGPPS